MTTLPWLTQELHQAALRDRDRPRILVIDDDPDVSRSLRLQLEPHGVEVVDAHDGGQGLCASLELRPNVIITDLAMPNDDGEFVVECLQGRSDTWHIPVIVLTGCQDQVVRQRMLSSGVVAYLTKPYNVDELLATLQRHIPLTAAGHPNSSVGS